jgi:transcriptional regulator with XRE-family HTH domain
MIKQNFILSELEHVGQRLKALRLATGLSRKAITDQYDIKGPTLVSWEAEKRGLKIENALILVKIYRDYGIDCTIDWLMKGKGINPLENAGQTPEKTFVLREIGRFKAFFPDAVVLELDDDYMAPWICKGDYVGGVYNKDLTDESFVNKPCIVKTHDFGVQARLVELTKDAGFYNLTSYSRKGNISSVKLEAVAPIVFVRKIVNNQSSCDS